MFRFVYLLFCSLPLALASSDAFDVCYCSNGLEDDTFNSAWQPQICVPVYPTDRPATEKAFSRNYQHRKSLDDGEMWMPYLRAGRSEDPAKTFTFQSSFTPRLGRSRSGGHASGDPSKHVINLNAGSAFTPRLGRRLQEN